MRRALGAAARPALPPAPDRERAPGRPGRRSSASLLAFWGVRGLVASLPANVPRADEIRVDGVVLAFTGALAVLTGLLFGIAPAWKISSGGVQGALREEGPRHRRPRAPSAAQHARRGRDRPRAHPARGRGAARAQLRARPGRRRRVPRGRRPHREPAPARRRASRRRRSAAAFVRDVVERVKAVPGVEVGERGPAPARRLAELVHAGRPAGAAAGPAPVRRHHARALRTTSAPWACACSRAASSPSATPRTRRSSRWWTRPSCAPTIPGESALGKRLRFGRSRPRGQGREVARDRGRGRPREELRRGPGQPRRGLPALLPEPGGQRRPSSCARRGIRPRCPPPSGRR